MLLARRRLAAALVCLGLGAVLGACGAEETMIVPSTSAPADTTTSVPDDSKVSATTSPMGSTSTTGHSDETTVTVSTTASSTTSTQPTTTTTSSSTTAAPATTTPPSTTVAPTTTASPTTTSTVTKTAPRLNQGQASVVTTVHYNPDGLFNSGFSWITTLPGSDNERFEWSGCADCPFEVVRVVSGAQPAYPGFLEVVMPLSKVSATYRWRVIATYWDGSELASETGTLTVYAFYPVTVSGTVVDASTGAAIDRVHLKLDSGPASWGRWTGTGGTFSCINCPGGPEPPTLTASKDGYETLVLPLNVGESVVLNLELNPTP